MYTCMEFCHLELELSGYTCIYNNIIVVRRWLPTLYVVNTCMHIHAISLNILYILPMS